MPTWDNPRRPWNVTTWPAPCGRRPSGPTCSEAWPAWSRGTIGGPVPPSTKSSGCGPSCAGVLQPGPGEVPPGRSPRRAGRPDASPGRPEAAAAAPISCGPESGRGKGTARAPGATRKTGLRGEPRDEQDLTAQGLARQPRDPGRPWRTTKRPEAQPALSDGPSEQGERPRREPRPHRGGHRGAGPASSPSTRTTCRPVPAGGSCTPGSASARPRTPTPARALQKDSKPFTVYQVAGIYALTSRQDPDDRQEALRLLGSALEPGIRAGPDRQRPRSRRDPRPARVPPDWSKRRGLAAPGKPPAGETPSRRPPAGPVVVAPRITVNPAADPGASIGRGGNRRDFLGGSDGGIGYS